MKPCYAPVPEGVMRKLEKQVHAAKDLGVTHRGSGVSYDAKIEGPGSVTLPLAVNSVIPTLRAPINGAKEPTVFMFDTGAQISLIDADTAVAANVSILDPSTTNITVMGVMGKERMLGGLLAPLQLGEAKITRQLCLVRTHQNETRWMGPLMKERVNMDLLGFDIVRQWCRHITVDYPQHKLTFGFKDDFKGPAAGRRSWKVPLVLEAGMPFVVLESRGIRWLALVDTGSAFGVEVDESLAAELDILKHAKPVPAGMVNTAIGGMADVKEAGIRLAMLKKLEGLGPVHENAEIAISPGGARVGSFFFKDYRLTMDLKNQVLWLER